jgi:hypothetical protein
MPGAVSEESAKGTEVEVQLVWRQTEALAHRPEGFFELHESQANRLHFSIGERARFHASNGLSFEQFPQKLHQRQHELRHGPLHVGRIGIPSRRAWSRQAPLQLRAQGVDIARRKRTEIVSAGGRPPGSHWRPRSLTAGARAGARSLLHRRSSGTNA